MSDVLETAAILIEPIQHCFGQSHEADTKQHKRGAASPFPVHSLSMREPTHSLPTHRAPAIDTLLLAVNIQQPEIVEVANGFQNVHRSLRGSEAVTSLECRPAVDIIDRGIQIIRLPKRILKPPASHAMGSQKHVSEIDISNQTLAHNGWWVVRTQCPI